MINEIVTAKKCSGCSACYNACPSNCIEMKYNTEGFLIPFASGNCTECGLCVKICPAIQDRKDKMYAKPEVYAAYLRDNEMLPDSTSGGIFIACAKWILQNGGIVCGAVFEKDYFVRLRTVDNVRDLKLLQGSKYVQSIPGKIYQEIKELLLEKNVLFTGLPCQVAGLKAFLGKEYNNLFTIDLICHGTPSPMLFNDYLHALENKHGGAIISFNQRFKYKNWSPMLTIYDLKKYDDGLSEVTHYTDDVYLKAFHENKTFNSICYDCKFAKLPRQGDISLGDFYGLGILFKFEDSCKNGVSQILVNSEKGSRLFRNIQKEIVSYRRPLEEALFYNCNIWKPSAKPKLRDEILHAYAEKGFDYVTNNYLKKSKKQTCIIVIKKIVRKVLNDKILLKLMLLLNRKSMDSKMNLIKEYMKGLDNDS